MGRKPRGTSKNGYYHILARGNNKKWLFQGDDDFKFYQETFASYFLRYKITLHHYCLMSNHLHFLVFAQIPMDLSKAMHGLQRMYFHYFRKKYNWAGHLFQGRYKSLAINDEKYLLECARYIERNPLRAKMVKNLDDWPYSSYRAYSYGEENRFINFSPAYLGLSANVEVRRKLYREYLMEDRLYEGLVDRQLVNV